MESDPSHFRLCRADGLVFLALLLGCLTVYAGAILIPYGFADDYPRLWRVLTHSPDAYTRLAAQGRPLNAVIVNWFFRRARTIAALGEVRLATVIEIAGMEWLFYLALLRTSGERLAAALGAGMACVMPAMQVYAGWANSVPIPVGGIAAAGAALICGWAMDHRRWAALVVPLILLVISAAIYQPVVMVFVPLAMLDCFSRNQSPRRGAVYAGVLVVGLLLGWCVFEYGVTHYPARADRSGMTGEPLAKLSGFVQYPLVDSLNLIILRPSTALAICVGIFLFAGLWLKLSGSLVRIVSAAILLPLCCLPTLVSQADSWSYRTQIGLEWMILALGWIALQGFRRWISVPPVLVVTLLLGGGLAAYNVTELIAWPQSLELSLLRIALSQPEARNARQIILLQPRGSDSPAPVSRYDEFGVPSLSEGWVPRSEVNVVRREIDRGGSAIEVDPVANLAGEYRGAVAPGAVVIDMREIGRR